MTFEIAIISSTESQWLAISRESVAYRIIVVCLLCCRFTRPALFWSCRCGSVFYFVLTKNEHGWDETGCTVQHCTLQIRNIFIFHPTFCICCHVSHWIVCVFFCCHAPPCCLLDLAGPIVLCAAIFVTYHL